MTDRFAFSPRAPADALALALGALPGVTPTGVAPRYLPEGARWVVGVHCATLAAVGAAFRVHALRVAEWPASEVVLEVEADPRHLAGAPPSVVVSRERGNRAWSSPSPPRLSGTALPWTAVADEEQGER